MTVNMKTINSFVLFALVVLLFPVSAEFDKHEAVETLHRFADEGVK